MQSIRDTCREKHNYQAGFFFMSQNIILHVRLKPFWLFLKIIATSHSRS